MNLVRGVWLFLLSLFLGHHGWEDGLSPLLYCFSFLFILAFTLSPVSTCKLNFLGLKICPVSPYLEWLGVVVKAEEHGSVRCRVLNGSNGSLPFVLGRYTIQRLLLYWHRYFLDLFSYYSYTVFALSSKGTSDMPRTESSSAMSQDYLDFYYTSSAIPFFGLGPNVKMGQGHKLLGPTSGITIFLK